MKKSLWVIVAACLVLVAARWRMGATETPGAKEPAPVSAPDSTLAAPAHTDQDFQSPELVHAAEVTPSDVLALLDAPPPREGTNLGSDFTVAVQAGLSGPGATDPAWGPALERAARDERIRRYIGTVWTQYGNWLRLQPDAQAIRRGLVFLDQQRQELAPPLTLIEDFQMRLTQGQLERVSGELTLSYETLQSLQRSMGETEAEGWALTMIEYLGVQVRDELIPMYLELGQPGAAKALVHGAGSGMNPAMKSRWLAWIALEGRRYGLVLRTVRSDAGLATDPTLSFLEGMALLRTGQAEEARGALERATSAPGETTSFRSNAALALIEALQESGDLTGAESRLSNVRDACLDVPLLAIRWRLLDDELRHTQDRAPRPVEEIRAAYGEWLDTWRSSPIVISGARFVSSQRRIDVLAGVLFAEHRRGDGGRAMLERLLEAQSCGTLARRIETPPVTVDELQRFLKAEGGGAVIYVPAPGSPLAFSVDAESVKFHEIQGAAGLTAIHRELRPMLEDDGREPEDVLQFTRLADQASELILPSEMLAHMEPWKITRCVGVDLVTRLPPALLRPGNGQWLGCQKRIVEWASVPIGIALSSRADPLLESPLAVLDPKLEARFSEPALHFTEGEQKNLGALFGGGLRIRLGIDATPAVLGEAQGELCYVHCHGRLDPDDPRPARILLAGPSGEFFPDAVEALFGASSSAPAQVILAACGAGHGRIQLGEDGADQLAAAFFLCGSKSVLASQSDLFHEATKRLVFDYLKELSAGAPPSEALRRARVSATARSADPRDFGTLRLNGGAK